MSDGTPLINIGELVNDYWCKLIALCLRLDIAMGDETTSKETRPTRDPDLDVLKEFVQELTQETDRAAIMLGSAKIEVLLGKLLDKFLLPLPGSSDNLLDADGPLSTFNARKSICYRLGLIDTKLAKLLHIFRRLRNSYAHEVTSANLRSGPGRDRVLSLAEPFSDMPYFKRMIEPIASTMKLSTEDPGVIFRSVFLLSYVHLHTRAYDIVAIEADSEKSIIETTMAWSHLAKAR